MFFVWRGRGAIAVVVLLVALLASMNLMAWGSRAAVAGGGVTLLAGGWACQHFGRRWNRGSGTHMMYGLPLEYWGWLHMIVGGIITLLAAIGVIGPAGSG